MSSTIENMPAQSPGEWLWLSLLLAVNWATAAFYYANPANAKTIHVEISDWEDVKNLKKIKNGKKSDT